MKARGCAVLLCFLSAGFLLLGLWQCSESFHQWSAQSERDRIASNAQAQRDQERLRIQQQAAEDARHGDITIPFTITSEWTEVPLPHDSKQYNMSHIHTPEDIDLYWRMGGSIYFEAAHTDIKLPPRTNEKLEVRTPTKGKYQASVRYYFVTQ